MRPQLDLSIGTASVGCGGIISTYVAFPWYHRHTTGFTRIMHTAFVCSSRITVPQAEAFLDREIIGKGSLAHLMEEYVFDHRSIFDINTNTGRNVHPDLGYQECFMLIRNNTSFKGSMSTECIGLFGMEGLRSTKLYSDEFASWSRET